ncbi:hypothetical protein J6590_038222 [Homalodisca vitripennis]|nr:hypothetical protein J6590_038222 [Homalodisca vitripennis]
MKRKSNEIVIDCEPNLCGASLYLPLADSQRSLVLPMVQCSGYSDYREITRSSNVERGCCLDGWPLSDPVLASKPACPAIGGGSEVTLSRWSPVSLAPLAFPLHGRHLQESRHIVIKQMNIKSDIWNHTRTCSKLILSGNKSLHEAQSHY